MRCDLTLSLFRGLRDCIGEVRADDGGSVHVVCANVKTAANEYLSSIAQKARDLGSTEVADENCRSEHETTRPGMQPRRELLTGHRGLVKISG